MSHECSGRCYDFQCFLTYHVSRFKLILLQLDLFDVSDRLAYPIYDGILHWCSTSVPEATDPIPPAAVSPRYGYVCLASSYEVYFLWLPVLVGRFFVVLMAHDLLYPLLYVVGSFFCCNVTLIIFAIPPMAAFYHPPAKIQIGLLIDAEA